MRQTKPTVILIGEILHETAKAIQFRFSDQNEEDDNGEPIARVEWFPFSQVDEIHRTSPARIVVSGWIYSEKEKSWT